MKGCIPSWIACLSLLAGCTHVPEQGLAAVSTRALSLPITVIASDVEGKACNDMHEVGRSREADAVAAALRNAPGANALMNAEFEAVQFHEIFQCILKVHGTAVRIEPR